MSPDSEGYNTGLNLFEFSISYKQVVSFEQ